MRTKFNDANPCMPKNLAKQLIIEGAKVLNHQQRQALLDIFMALDQAEKTAEKILQQHAVAQQSTYNFSQVHECQDEDNQEYWSGHYYDSYSQEYPEDWVKRTQSTPHRHKFPRTAY